MKRLIGLVAVALLAGCAPTPSMTPAPAITPLVHTYGYYVDGSASGANVTYTTGSGTSQAEVGLPLRNKAGKIGLQMVGNDAPRFLYISAQNTGDYGDLTCQITVDGVVVAQNSASGAFTIATCETSR